jgi:hypothetical protein
MNWTVLYLMMPVDAPPISGRGQRGIDDPPNQISIGTVKWKDGELYGVVQLRFDGTAWVTCFVAKSTAVQHRDSRLRRGSVTFDLSKGITEPMDGAQVKWLMDQRSK